MSEGWARLALTGYRWLGAAAYPFVGTYLALRAARGKEEHPRRRERYGHASVPRPPGPLVWFHAASVGETTAVLPLIREVRSRDIGVVLTTGTVTSAAIVRERLNGSVIHQYVPLDLQPAVSRFLDHWQPDLAVIAESEIWPMTILELGARRMPQVLVNGRLSDRSFASWSKRPSLADALFENLSHVIAQSDLDAERFRALGARPVTVSGNLKVDTDAPPCDEAALATYRRQSEGRRIWAAVSTFEGEEAMAATVHARLSQGRNVLTVVVPRHPERADVVEQMLRSNGLSVARRTRRDQIDGATDVLLGDTIGEMGLYLNLAEIAFVGRSLAHQGGQNPLEPVAVGCAVIAGRNVQNFREVYQRLLKNGGVGIVKDEAGLCRAVEELMDDDKKRRAMVAAGRRTIEEMRGALALTIRTLEPYITPLTVKARLTPPDTDGVGG